jgi:hypothetical protein
MRAAKICERALVCLLPNVAKRRATSRDLVVPKRSLHLNLARYTRRWPVSRSSMVRRRTVQRGQMWRSTFERRDIQYPSPNCPSTNPHGHCRDTLTSSSGLCRSHARASSSHIRLVACFFGFSHHKLIFGLRGGRGAGALPKCLRPIYRQPLNVFDGMDSGGAPMVRFVTTYPAGPRVSVSRL